ncbi:MAG: endolytic transglycosylase MltG [Acidobacteria bacterium]|nr:endolytic transglycosylase MltG [Acidobacteriota bacterium]
MNGSSRALAGVTALGVVLVAAAAGWTWFLSAPTSSTRAAEPLTISIPQGATARHVAQLLEREGVIRSARLFSLLLRFTGADRRIQAGDHTIRAGLNAGQLVRELQRAELITTAFTIPEGLTLDETAAVIAAAGIANRDELRTAFQDPAPVLALDPRAPNLEGYLFPDTYRVFLAAKPREIAELLVATFRRRFADPRAAEIERSGRTLRDIVTLASLVEEETAVPLERPRVAGVFAERLARGMRLQCDPTVIYALRLAGAWNGNLRREDLERDHPYNTYTRAGLPPGPIAAPGLASLEAALAPQRDGSLYFVARRDGTHVFSTSLEQHSRAVRQFQLRH